MINIKSIINHGKLIEKLAVVVFDESEDPLPFTDWKAPEPLPAAIPTGGSTGIKKYFQAGRNVQAIFTKRASFNLSNTLSKARTKADVQPLYKDQGIISKPTDIGTQITAREGNKNLSHLVDNRIKPTKFIKKI